MTKSPRISGSVKPRFEAVREAFVEKTILAFLALTVFGLFVAPQIISGPPQSGLQERVMGYGYLLWQAILFIVLLRKEKELRQNLLNSDVIMKIG